MKAVKCLCLAAALATLGSLSVGTSADASHYGHRQYYSGWYKHNSYNYHYRYYYYKPTPSYYGYKYHYTLHYPSRPKYYYYYNHYNKKFYGRCPVDYGGKPVYSWLKPADQHEDITKIDEAKFPVPDGVSTPPLPESDPKNEVDNKAITMDLPPGDPPGDVKGLPVGN